MERRVGKTDDPGSGLPRTSRSLPMALIRAREAVMAPIRGMLAKTGLTEQQWRILRVLAEQGPLDSSRLAARASLLLPSVTRIVQSMRDRGLVEQGSDASDRRRLIVSITAEGRQIIDDNTAEAAAIAQGFRDRLGPERHEALLDLLEDLSKLGDRTGV